MRDQLLNGARPFTTDKINNRKPRNKAETVGKDLRIGRQGMFVPPRRMPTNGVSLRGSTLFSLFRPQIGICSRQHNRRLCQRNLSRYPHQLQAQPYKRQIVIREQFPSLPVKRFEPLGKDKKKDSVYSE